MTRDEATALLAATLREVAPEADLGAVDPGLPLQEVADIDSVDFLAVVAAIQDRAGIEIPPRDYPKLATLERFVSYLMSAVDGVPRGQSGNDCLGVMPGRFAARNRWADVWTCSSLMCRVLTRP